MSESAIELPLYDVTARKVHQWAMIALVVVAFLVEGVPAVALLLLAGVVMLVGRYWWPAVACELSQTSTRPSARAMCSGCWSDYAACGNLNRRSSSLAQRD